MKHHIIVIVLTLLGLFPNIGKAQQYTGTSGLAHVPSAEMYHEGLSLATLARSSA